MGHMHTSSAPLWPCPGSDSSLGDHTESSPQSPTHLASQLGSLHPLARCDAGTQPLTVTSVWAQKPCWVQLQGTAPLTPRSGTMHKRHHVLKSVSKSLDHPGEATETQGPSLHGEGYWDRIKALFH